MKFFFSFFTLIFWCVILYAQPESLVLDTIKYSDYQLVLFDDYTWKYVNHDSVENEIIAKKQAAAYEYIIKNKVYEPDSLEVFENDWDEIELFAYGGINFQNCQDTFAIPLMDKDSFVIPFQGRICSEFGWRGGRMHNGIDIKLQTGEPVLAAFSGKVRKAYYNSGGYGRLIILRHANGLETYYAHLSKTLVEAGDWVNAGDTIALGGNTGRSFGSHLHWEVRLKDNPFDPRLVADFENNSLVSDTLVLTSDNFKHVKELSQATYHRIKSGDTLWAISRRYGVSINRICAINGISESSILRLGQSLRVR